MSFFYDLNKKLDSIRATPEVTHKQLNERGEKWIQKAVDPSHKGDLHTALHVPQGKTIPKSKIDKAAHSKDSHLRHMAQFAKNVAKEDQQVDEKVETFRSNDAGKMVNTVKTGKGPAPSPQATRDSYAKDVKALRASGGLKKDSSGQRSGVAPSGRRIEIDNYEESAMRESGGPAAAPAKSMVDKSTATAGRTPPYVPTDTRVKPEPKDNGMGRIVQGTWQADPKGKVPAPSGDPEGVRSRKPPPENGMGRIVQGTWQADPKGKVPAPSGDPEGVKEGSKKLNFADKIANAKKEVDEMLGDVAAEAMRSALSPKQKKMAALGGNPERIDGPDLAALRKGADMGEERSKGTAFDMSTPRAATPKVGSTERGHKHDITHSTSDPRYKGRTVIRRTDAQGISVGSENDDEGNQKEKRTKAGRPDGTGKKIGAKGPSGKSKLMTKEGDMDVTDQGEYDQEGNMAKGDIKTIVRHAQALYKILGDNDNLPEWVQSKLAKVESMMVAVDEYMQNQDSDDGEEPIAEKAVSKKQQGLPKKVSKNKAVDEADENYENGKLTTTQTGPGQSFTSSSTGRVNATVGNGKVTVKPGKPMDDDADTASVSNKESNKDTSSSKSNGMVGKGIYDSMNYELEQMIAESMSVNMSDSTEGNKSLTVTATDDDAMKLAMILKSAGLGGSGGDMHSHGEEACDTCGMQDCGCGDIEQAIDENAPDWPTNTEQADNNFGYSGGLNKPKSSGIATGSVTDVSMAGEDQFSKQVQRMREMAGIQNEEHVDLGPPDPETAHMTPDEVNAALYLGSDGSHADMTSDEVNAAFKAGSGPAPDEVYGGSGNKPPQYEDSIQRMREMAGIKEAKKATRDWDNDGNIESGPDEHAGSVDKAIKKAQAEKQVDESIFALTNQWKAYKG